MERNPRKCQEIIWRHKDQIHVKEERLEVKRIKRSTVIQALSPKTHIHIQTLREHIDTEEDF